MDRAEFLASYETASGEVKQQWVKHVITKADDIGMRFYEQRGHENLIIDMEEMDELSQQISKQLRGKGDYYSLLEEMADVQICLYHLQNLFNITDEELNKAINVKIGRMARRLRKLEEEQ
jgi:NTP pyrophosphatase (non-canonical NTP hydrolase)